MEYVIQRGQLRPRVAADWDDPAWGAAEVMSVNSFHPASGDHRPRTEARMLYDEQGVYVNFRSLDRYVRCTRTEHQAITSRDSCVEAYLQPKTDRGYFNFEANALGAMLSFYITDPTRCDPGIFKGKEVLPRRLLETIRIGRTLAKAAPIEIAAPMEWAVEYLVPNEVFEHFVGNLEAPRNRKWRGNFFKCADETSHPHWASWNPIGAELNFHDPKYFAPIRFA